MKPNDEKLSKFWEQLENDIENIQYEKINGIINKNKLASLAIYKYKK